MHHYFGDEIVWRSHARILHLPSNAFELKPEHLEHQASTCPTNPHVAVEGIIFELKCILFNISKEITFMKSAIEVQFFFWFEQ